MTPRVLSARKTKIVCTIGPSSASEERLEALARAGMNVARLNFSHGSHEEHGRVIERIRRIGSRLGEPIAVLQDLAGPKVRIGTFAKGSVELKAGEIFTLTTRSVEGDARRVSVSYAGLPGELKQGDALLLADGTLELRAESISSEEVRCRVVVGGPLSGRKGVNCPSGLFGVPILREQDIDDLRFGIEQGVDFVGLSFVRGVDDVHAARKAIAACRGSTPIIAKIETRAALGAFDAVLEAADGIMIARGDLGIETPFARVPMVQKGLIRKAIRRAKPVITATQMLFSMVSAPRPTRAEVADVANAILDGSDAVMLSEETTVGRYPVETVRTMAGIAAETEAETDGRRCAPESVDDRPGAGAAPTAADGTDTMAQAACRIAARLRHEAIATVTVTGWTARFVARHRPAQPILAATPRAETYRALSLVRGVTPLLLPEGERSREEMMQSAEREMRRAGWQGKSAVILSSTAAGRHLLTTTTL